MSRDSTVVQHENGLAKITELQGASYNPRLMPDKEMKSLMNSLREFGFVQPVVARKEDGLILGGHQRVEARKRIAAEDKEDLAKIKVPVVWVKGITDDKAKLLNVALNRIHGEWDYGKLGELFESIKPDEKAPMHLSGFSDREVEDILKLTTEAAAMSTDDGEDIDVDAELAAEARKFPLEVGTDDDAKVVREALAAYGATSPANQGAALAKMARAALTHIKCEESICE